MEHEVLFRGKDMFTGQWVEGYYFETGYGREECHYIFSGKVDTQSRYGPIYEKAQVEPATVGQYTGLTDRDGKKIFEGDIVTTPKYGVDNGKGQNYSGKDKFVVGYSDGTYTLENGWRRFCLRPDIDAVVCGNIYDNPELLEVKK